MNRIVLIGNGFDLAHGMPTRYNDFLLWYIKFAFNYASTNTFNSKLFLVRRHLLNMWPSLDGSSNSDKFINRCYKKGDLNALFDGTLPDYRENNLDVVVHSKFFKILLEKCHIQNWVEIENEFYKELKRLLEAGKSIDISNDLNELNISMQSIIEAMQLYLSELKCLNEDLRFAEIFMLPISFDEIPEINQMKYVLPKETLILNFNYTNTVNRYLKELVKIPGLSFKVNNIHGELGNYENPIVFGFGDELDEDYKLMEKSSTKGFFKYIKSFWYFKTENYHNLIRFIQSDDFQVIILGHSCGLSDRTMLNMIFEHDNCKSIKIYYHQYSNNDNYTDLTEEISRHFSNKTAMRAKLIPKPLCSRMPQANPIKNEKLSDN